MAEFLAMGGYAAYVWPSFAVTTFVLGGMAWHAWATRRRLTRALKVLGQDATEE